VGAAVDLRAGGAAALAATLSASDVAANDGVANNDAKDGVNELASGLDIEKDNGEDSRPDSEEENVGGAASGAWLSCSVDCI